MPGHSGVVAAVEFVHDDGNYKCGGPSTARCAQDDSLLPQQQVLRYAQETVSYRNSRSFAPLRMTISHHDNRRSFDCALRAPLRMTIFHHNSRSFATLRMTQQQVLRSAQDDNLLPQRPQVLRLRAALRSGWRRPGGAKPEVRSFRLRLHSGLRQSGTGLRPGWFVARLKPGPSGVWPWWSLCGDDDEIETLLAVRKILYHPRSGTIRANRFRKGDCGLCEQASMRAV